MACFLACLLGALQCNDLHHPLLLPCQGTGEDSDDVQASSASLEMSEEGYTPVFFTPRELRNLVLVDELPGLAPLVDMRVANLLDEEVPQVYALTGR